MDKFQKPILLYPTNYKNSLKYNKGKLKRSVLVKSSEWKRYSGGNTSLLYDKLGVVTEVMKDFMTDVIAESGGSV
ncbi:hypothetical protein GCM10008022_37850 [Paenibacillus hunanensis]|nr:hypothetical protein GCM10008022_37850 [Paenibacillus hunanensis]